MPARKAHPAAATVTGSASDPPESGQLFSMTSTGTDRLGRRTVPSRDGQRARGTGNRCSDRRRVAGPRVGGLAPRPPAACPNRWAGGGVIPGVTTQARAGDPMRNVLVEKHPYRVRIYPRRRRATSVALFSLGFAALGLYCLITFILPAAPDDVSFGAILFVVVTVGLLGPAGLHHGYMVFRHSPILVLDEDGIRDSSSLFSVGF